ncbi:hypothetical protein A0H76_1175 [Hepatospora eriocheir]|uniref:Uncharacterized protein n=1 Tax=Hepatospora eriocheir TaxID=1081669 RepID=A0A1X0QKU8_9MICR|nr:hypothetical protein A0H76_1175 [Hepatospora eriocheir]
MINDRDLQAYILGLKGDLDEISLYFYMKLLAKSLKLEDIFTDYVKKDIEIDYSKDSSISSIDECLYYIFDDKKKPTNKQFARKPPVNNLLNYLNKTKEIDKNEGLIKINDNNDNITLVGISSINNDDNSIEQSNNKDINKRNNKDSKDKDNIKKIKIDEKVSRSNCLSEITPQMEEDLAKTKIIESTNKNDSESIKEEKSILIKNEEMNNNKEFDKVSKQLNNDSILSNYKDDLNSKKESNKEIKSVRQSNLFESSLRSNTDTDNVTKEKQPSLEETIPMVVLSKKNPFDNDSSNNLNKNDSSKILLPSEIFKNSIKNESSSSEGEFVFDLGSTIESNHDDGPSDFNFII